MVLPASPELMFDALSGGAGPASALGPRIEGSVVQARFETVVVQARAALSSFFSIDAEPTPQLAKALDGLVRGLWESGWDPASGRTDMFTLHLGALLMDAVLRTCGGEAVFRSDRELTHASVWFAAAKVELFPFHKAYRALTRRGESLEDLYRIAAQLRDAGAGGPLEP